MEKMRFCQSCGMPLTDEVLGTNADGSKNEDYCMYCYRDGKFLQDCTMEEMIEHCAQFVGAVNEGLEKPITKEEYIGMMKTYFPQLKRWRKALAGADATACVKSTCFNMRKVGYVVHVFSDCVTSYDLKKLPEMLAYYEKQGCELITIKRK